MRTRRDEPDDGWAPNLTPFIDIMFILIIFFLATSRFTQDERDESIRLVQSRSKMPINTPSNLLVINIDKEGRTIVDGRSCTFEELETIVRERRRKTDAEVTVRADSRGIIEPLQRTQELCHRLGFKTPHVTYGAVGE